MLRSGKYGPTYVKATRERLMGMVYDWPTGKGVERTEMRAE